MSHFETELWLPVTPQRAFELLADARNLNLVTPAWFRLDILSPTPIRMKVGASIDYRLRWRFVSLAWRSRVTRWQPHRRFTYVQDRGPYRHFAHDHLFEPERGGVRIVDRIAYRVVGGELVGRWLVDPDLGRIFRHRAARARRLLAPPTSA